MSGAGGLDIDGSGIGWLPRLDHERPVSTDAARLGEATLRLAASKANDPADWTVGRPDLQRGLRMLDALRESHRGLVADVEFDHVEGFLRRSHAVADGEVEIERFDYAFVVPTRTSSGGFADPDPGEAAVTIGERVMASQGMEYIDEMVQAMPFVDRLDPWSRTQFWSTVPTTIIDRYEPSSAGHLGAIVYAPLTIDTIFGTPDRRALRTLAVEAIGSGLDLAQHVGGARFAGLGAFFPSLTHYGRLLERDGMRLTTGHAGTIAVMAQTLRRILGAPGYEHCSTIGIVGAGAIGAATVDHLCATTDHDFVIFDIDAAISNRLADAVNQRESTTRAVVVESMQQVCDRTRIVMAATTTPVPFDEIDDPSVLGGLVIVDDSEPGAFNDPRYRDAGARPVGVVGEVPLAMGRRANGYTYGGELAAPHHVYGCEAEVKTLDELELHHEGVTRRAEPSDVAFVSECFDQVGVIASPLQHRGELELLVP